MQRFSFSNNRGTTCVMGIINISTDSFYEKSRCYSKDEVLDTAQKMISEGADYLDLGAESSRPGSKPISDQEEIDKLIPVLSSLVKEVDIPISVDTYKPAVAHEALQVGAKIINDIRGLQITSEMAEVISRFNGGVVIMHMRGSPLTMQENPKYQNVVNDVKKFLAKSIKIAEKAGILPDQVAVDPGIGFGKAQKHNLEILNNLEKFTELEKPILLGISRKSFIGNILNLPPEGRLEGSLAASAIGVYKGISILRTHDVKATRNAIKVVAAITKGENM